MVGINNLQVVFGVDTESVLDEMTRKLKPRRVRDSL